MKRSILFLIWFVCGMANIHAQAKQSKIGFRAISGIGLMNGSKGAAMALQAVAGAAYRGTFLGAGLGIDYYRYRSIPVFAHASQDLIAGTRALFIYGDLGYNYDWVTSKNREQANIDMLSNFQGGLYYEAGLGFRISFKTGNALLLSTGFSHKKLRRKGAETSCPFIGPCRTVEERYEYLMPRFAIRAGWQF